MRYKRYKPEFLSIKSTLCENMRQLITPILLLLIPSTIHTQSTNQNNDEYAVVTSIRYCELYDPEILEAKRGLEEQRKHLRSS